MRRNIIILVATIMLLTSCGTYMGSNMSSGAYFGSILGNAVGGLAGGHRGSHIGTMVGMTSGALVGAAADRSAMKRRNKDMAKYNAEKQRLAQNRKNRRNTSKSSQYNQYNDQYDSGFDQNNSGDDRIEDFTKTSSSTTATPSASFNPSNVPTIEIRNLTFADNNNDQMISRGEECWISFEVYNNGTSTIYNLLPSVLEVSGNKHIYISQNTMVESIAPGKGIRYTAMVRSDRKLKDGVARFNVCVTQNGANKTDVKEFAVKTIKK